MGITVTIALNYTTMVFSIINILITLILIVLAILAYLFLGTLDLTQIFGGMAISFIIRQIINILFMGLIITTNISSIITLKKIQRDNLDLISSKNYETILDEEKEII